jgi:hypothetical protein
MIGAFPERCKNCQHWTRSIHCEAFPGPDDRIPDDVLTGANDHSAPIKGDHGIQFAPKTQQEADK